MLRTFTRDNAQQAFNFLVAELTNIETEIYRTKYADIIYAQLVPVDSSGNPWAKSFTYFSIDTVGNADWWNGMAKDIPLADINRQKREQGVGMAAIGYRYDLEEIAQAQMLNISITTEKALAARRAAEEFMDRLTRSGDPRQGMTGLVNSPLVTVTDAIADGTGASPLWAEKTGDQMARDINSQLTQINAGSLGIEMADTVLLPIAQMNALATSRLSNTDIPALQFVQKYNVFTNQTGTPLMIRAINGLSTAGVGGVSRMVTYRRDPMVVKLNVPMPHHFDPAFQSGPITFDIPGYLRTGGVQIRRPAAFAYLDGI